MGSGLRPLARGRATQALAEVGHGAALRPLGLDARRRGLRVRQKVGVDEISGGGWAADDELMKGLVCGKEMQHSLRKAWSFTLK